MLLPTIKVWIFEKNTQEFHTSITQYNYGGVFMSRNANTDDNMSVMGIIAICLICFFVAISF